MKLPGLARALNARAWTIQDLADESKISYPTCYKAAKGFDVSLPTALQIARTLDQHPPPASLDELRETAPEPASSGAVTEEAGRVRHQVPA
jgi:hypothetical protein